MRSTGLLRAGDVLVVVALAVSGQVTAWSASSASWEGGRAVHAVLLATATWPLLVRRRWPVLVLVLVTGAGWIQYELGAGTFQPWFALLLGLYSLGAYAHGRLAVLATAAPAAAVLAVDVPRLAAGTRIDEVLPAWGVLAGAWAFGRWMRRRGSETAELAERAETAEREREQEAQRAVADERARIARELHDLVAHSMGVIVIQAQAAQRCLDADPAAARAALAAVESVGRQGLGEMRRLLDLLTGTDRSGPHPQPGLNRLGDLVEQVRGAGLPVEVEVRGELAGLPAGVDLAAYRIVQESLTNVLKHARATTAHVVVRRSGQELDIEVRDDGAGVTAPSGPGRGLVGMRERVALYGGHVEAGAAAEGGYRVRATLQVGETG